MDQTVSRLLQAASKVCLVAHSDESRTESKADLRPMVTVIALYQTCLQWDEMVLEVPVWSLRVHAMPCASVVGSVKSLSCDP